MNPKTWNSKTSKTLSVTLKNETNNVKRYFGDVPVDLSGIFWVLSINDRKLINSVLRDRLHIVSAPDPSVADKIATAQQIMIPEIMETYGLCLDDIEFSNDVLKHIINSKTNNEKGLRAFKQCIEAIVKRVAYLKHTLIGLPPSAIWHAATVSAASKPVAKEEALPLAFVMAPPVVQQTGQMLKKEREVFASQTSFHFPDFKIPLILSEAQADKLLAQIQPNKEFDWVQAGWIR